MATTHPNGIDPTGPTGRLIQTADLRDNPAPQAIATDTKNGYVFVLQLESQETAARTSGNLILNRFSRQTGAYLDSMQLVGFGHGLSLGAEPVITDSGTYLWTECAPLRVTTPADPTEAVAYGTSVTRFTYDGGGVLNAKDPELPKFTPPGGSTATGPSYDPTTTTATVTVMHIQGETRYFTRYEAAKAAAGTWTPIGDPLGIARTQLAATVAPSLPTKPALAEKLSFQGFQTLGDILYVYQWAKYTEAEGTFPGHTLLRRFRWSTGLPIDQEPVVVTSAPGLERREPEGLAAEIDPVTGQRRLLFGFSNKVPDGEPGERDVTICWYPTEAPVEGVQVLADWEDLALAGGFLPGAERPQGRLVALAGTTYLQLRGSLSVSPGLTEDRQVATLPHRLRPTVQLRHNAPRNNNKGRAICRVEANIRGELWVFGATSDNAITWVDLDSVSAVWR
ncbi:hypothetical protein ACIBG6_28350 [Streptomyces sp. NPDC050842]|uniref:hypothetical protein n=1 Tax=Streptomyces sp. NPDC050842 TaxID=3365636 RepID=UPI00379478FD